MDSEPSSINWIDDSSKPPGSFAHQGFALVKLKCVHDFEKRRSFFSRSPKRDHVNKRMKQHSVRRSANSPSVVLP